MFEESEVVGTTLWFYAFAEVVLVVFVDLALQGLFFLLKFLRETEIFFVSGEHRILFVSGIKNAGIIAIS